MWLDSETVSNVLGYSLAMRHMVHLTLVLLVFVLPLSAQHEGHGCSDMIGWVPKEILERPTTLKQGVGAISDPVTTKSPDAQAFYNQGVAYLHSYVWIEAARSFHRALRADATLAIACARLARTYLNLDNQTEAKAQLQMAQALAKDVSPREQRRIEIMARHLDAVSAPRDRAKLQEYRAFLDQALTDFPKDPESWTIRGNAEEATAYGRGQRGGVRTIAFYHGALAVAPGHWGANHYLIHSYEFIGQVEDALKHGLIYADAAPAIPHAHHMYGHDLRRAGRIHEAIERFLRADALETAYYRDEKIDAQFDWHHAHNLSLLATAYQYQGKLKLTEDVLLKAIASPPVTEYHAFYHKDYAEFLLNRHRYADALAAARKLQESKYALARTAGHVLAGNAQLGLDPKNVTAAQAELKSAEAEAKQAGDTSLVEPYLDALRAEILLRTGKTDEANIIFKDVIRRVRAIPGPDAWMQAIYRLELIARIARENSDWELADHTAKQMLDHDKHYGGSQYVMGLVEEHKGNGAAARQWLSKAKAAWSDADPGFLEPKLQQLKEAANAPDAETPVIAAAPASAASETVLVGTPLEAMEMKFDPRAMT